MTERKHSELPWIVRRTSVKMVLEGNFHQITTSDDFPPAFVPAWDAPKAGQLDGTEEALGNARLEIEYLHGKFQETGTGNATINHIDAALSKARGDA